MMAYGIRLSMVLVAALAAALSAGAGAPRAAPFETSAREAILVDAETGTVLLEKDADQPMPPASMSKLMTAYMVFERLKQGALSLDTVLPVSEKAWRTGGSKMFVEVNTSVSVKDLLHGVIVQSGNDACVVLAEGLAGTEEAFSAAMTERGREIGLTNSSFKNATGWPAEGHFMSARDLAILTARIVQDFPEYFPYFKEVEFTYNGIRQGNRNPLLYKSLGADGMKTGHTEEAGYGLTGTAIQNGRRLIVVVSGMNSPNARSNEAERLLTYGFNAFGNYKLFSAGDVVERADVWLGDQARVPLVIADNLTVTLPRASRKDLKVAAVFDSPIPAPIAKGMPVAKLVISAPDMAPREVPLLAGADVGALGMFSRIGAALSYLIFGPPSS